MHAGDRYSATGLNVIVEYGGVGQGDCALQVQGYSCSLTWTLGRLESGVEWTTHPVSHGFVVELMVEDSEAVGLLRGGAHGSFGGVLLLSSLTLVVG